MRPQLRGTRFENGGIPKDVLSDLIALQEMVTDVARWVYLKDHPNHKRSPQGFSEVDLELVGIESGSAVPVIKLTTTQSRLDGQEVPYQESFVKARDMIADFITRVAQDGQLPSNESFPHEKLEYFTRIGHGLRDEESMELNTSALHTPAILTVKVRKKILHLVSEAKHTAKVVLRGLVHKVDQKNMTFGLQQIYGPMVTGKMSDLHYDTIMSAFKGYRSNTMIKISGTAQNVQGERITNIEPITQVHLLNRLDVSAQLDEMRNMKNGWLDGEGIAPDHKGLDWLSRIFEQHYPDNTTLPYTCPTPEGGIDMEWSAGKREISLEIDLAKRNGEWSWYDVDTRHSDEKVLDLEKSSSWKWIADQIRSMEEASK